MRLIGMLDSPYVRRVAISLDVLNIPFQHDAVSVFQDFDRFRALNPVVKAPTLVCDDGTVLMDSSLILQFVEFAIGRSLWSTNVEERQNQFRWVGLALAACEKSVQLIYERNLRPRDFQYEPWLARVTDQLIAAYGELESEIERMPTHWTTTLNQASITVAVAWQLTQSQSASRLPAEDFPGLVQLSERMEGTRSFKKFPPVGPGVQNNR